MLELKITPIGKISHPCDGTDEYLLVRNRNDDITKRQVQEEVFPAYYRECSGPGGYFCTNFRYIPDPLFPNLAIVIIEHRRDI